MTINFGPTFRYAVPGFDGNKARQSLAARTSSAELRHLRAAMRRLHGAGKTDLWRRDKDHVGQAMTMMLVLGGPHTSFASTMDLAMCAEVLSKLHLDTEEGKQLIAKAIRGPDPDAAVVVAPEMKRPGSALSAAQHKRDESFAKVPDHINAETTVDQQEELARYAAMVADQQTFEEVAIILGGDLALRDVLKQVNHRSNGVVLQLCRRLQHLSEVQLTIKRQFLSDPDFKRVYGPLMEDRTALVPPDFKHLAFALADAIRDGMKGTGVLSDPLFILQEQLKTGNAVTQATAAESGFVTAHLPAAMHIDRKLVVFTEVSMALQTAMAATADDLYTMLAEMIVSGGGL